MTRFRKYLTHLVLWCPALMAGCIKEIEIFTDTSRPNLVIDGAVTTAPGPQKVRVSYPVRYNNPVPFETIQKAIVEITDDLGNVTPLRYTENGTFETSPAFSGEIGRSYSVSVTFESGDRYASVPDTLYAVPAVDRFVFRPNNSADAPALDFLIDFQDDPGVANYYRWRYTNTYEFLAPVADELRRTEKRMQNTTCVRWDGVPPLASEVYLCWIDVFDNEFLHIESDLVFDGRKMEGFKAFTIPLDRKFDRGYVAEVSQHSLSKQAFTFWNAIEDQIGNNGTIFETSNYQIRGNVYSVTNPDEVVLGFFGASDVSSRSLPIGDYMGMWGNVCCDCTENCTPARCLDCRFASGKSFNKKPEFWPW